ncbi:MAG: AAA family ATPase [Candidatus Saccharibacteria bacterium]|nr:AAA family ATPase [Candidatus Saccharibacteria bacterium]
MLKKIILDNYKTYINPTEIDFSAKGYEFLEEENVGSNKILKGALFVGENASGKTQILRAMRLLLNLLFGTDRINFFYNKSFYSEKDEYSITYVFAVEDSEIRYKIGFGNNGILMERLTLDGKSAMYRFGKKARFMDNDLAYNDALSDKLLLLRRVYYDTHFNGNPILKRWFAFLQNSVYVNCYEGIVESENKNVFPENYLNEKDAEGINKFLKEIGYRQKIKYDTEVKDAAGHKIWRNDNAKFVSFVKEGTGVYIPEFLESTGNKTLMYILPTFLHAVNVDCMVILDEFSSGLHNEMEECLIKFFHRRSQNSQLFFTSHSTNILNNAILRPDQIYAVSFKGKEGSVLKRFSDESPREAQNIEKMYLNGIFEGMPKYGRNLEI